MTNDYESDGFYKDFIIIDFGDHEEVAERYIRICQDDYYADVIINDTIYLGEWLDDEERYIVFL